MMPNMDPRAMAKLMNQMGIKNVQIPSTKVVIYKEDGSTFVVENPSVTEITMSGQKSYQITGDVREGTADDAGSDSEAGAASSTPSEDDVALVAEQAKTTKDKAKAALEEADGDIAEAIMLLEKGE
jgi:nascent polypeptide-associated complex subunit alpha